MSVHRLWFVPGTGIDRGVISSSIQRYLGNDATVRPGKGNEPPHMDVDGYWIKATRTLTNSQLQDLQRDSARHKTTQAPPRAQQPRRAANDPYQAPLPAHDPGYGRPPPAGGNSPGGMDLEYTGRPMPAYEDDRPRGPPYRPEPGYPPVSNRYDDQYGGYNGRRPEPTERYDADRHYPPRGAYDDGRLPYMGRPQYDDGRPEYTGGGPYRANMPLGYEYDQRIPPRPMNTGAAPLPGYNPGPPNAGYPGRPDDGYYPPAGYGAPMNAPIQPPYNPGPYSGTPGQMPREEDRRRFGGSGDYSPDSTSRDSRDGRERYAYPSPPVTVVGNVRDNALNTTQASAFPPASTGAVAPPFGYDGRPGAQVPRPPQAQSRFEASAIPVSTDRTWVGQGISDDMDVEQQPRQKARRMQ